ncbi:FIT family protein [Biomphalaria glabrata]|uniref:Acyl-coenzyme A diphosphatase FITM2-like n=1 Tax=Biomphalaria glabrata TaxID=6526 RepID=A0A9W3AVI0_BIOGL|nr:acyl-coenzyme A diphosphatase FITM2-like [Biomphalaria glabrata]KAI8746509.1 FIT family protein CG10671 [Biomphalaria glabrata]KAI8763643.1 FIT family protein [Biomphalaria glabrata]
MPKTNASAKTSARRQEFNRSNAQQQKTSVRKSTGLKLPEPTHVGHFIVMVIMKICRSILFVDTGVKIGVYLIGVMICSIICDLFVVPRTYMSEKHNILNKYFVKLGWAWTLTFVTAYIILTSLVYCCNNVAKMCQHILRVAVGTLLWYTCTSLFLHVESIVGVCTANSHDNKTACMDAGKNWLGFDISGHVFLEMHSLLTISEEVKTFKYWAKLGKILEDENLSERRPLSEEEIGQARMNYRTLTPYIKAIIVVLAIMMVLFEVMLFFTTIYRFHTLPQKVSASFVAVGCWFLSYQILYKSGNPFPFMPVSPGVSPLQFMK